VCGYKFAGINSTAKDAVSARSVILITALRSPKLAPTAPSPGSAAATAAPAAAAPAATPTTSATSATTTTTTASANDNGDLLRTAADIFLIEQMERGETDVGHLLFAKNETLIGHGIAGLRDVGRWRRGRGCAPDQRKAQSGGTQHLDGTRFAFTSLPRSLFDP
jgi:hypothetical protein